MNKYRRRPIHYESAEQAAVIAWARGSARRYPELDLLFAIPNGGKRPSKQDKKGHWYSPEAIRLKREGVKAGVPDIFLPVARSGYHGLFIEMKYGDNKPSPEQTELLNRLEEEGYLVSVEYRSESACQLLRNYLEGKCV